MYRNIVIIPTYNEKDNIEKIITDIFSLEVKFDILIIDDASPDGTSNIVRSLQQFYPESLFILERAGKLGLGTAYIEGFKWAITHEYDYIYEMDADFSHNPKDLIRLYDECSVGGADVAIGSRYVTGVNVVNWPFKRILMSYFASLFVRIVTRMPIKDSTAGFVCYNKKSLKSLNLDAIRMKGYGFQIEMKYLLWKKGFSIHEVSIIFTDRTAGESKMSSSIFGEAFWGVLLLRLRKVK